MAKKRAAPKRRTKKKIRRPDLTLQLLKIFGSVALLILLLVGAGFLAHYSLQIPERKRERPPTADSAPTRRPEPPPPKPASKPPSAGVSKPAAKPTYEVYPVKEPLPKPVEKLTPIEDHQAPLVAIIIDDIGYDAQIGEMLLDLNAPLTFAFLPQAPFSRELLGQARSSGHEIMLHLPMEPNEYPDVDPGPGALLSAMSPDRLISQLESDLDELPGIKGVNNHMGSRLSASPEQMRQILSIVKKRGLFYVDSRTSAETVARASAKLLKVPFAERDIFIDHVDDPESIRSQIQRLVKRAQKQGYAIGIAHPHAHTYKILKEMLPEIKNQVQLVPASKVVQIEITKNGE
jgi:hypothetical protein